MTSSDSITHWLQQLQTGERHAVQKLWELYFQRLVGLARKNLQGIPRAAADEEDVALSAFKSFCLAAEKGRFPRLEDSDDLWQILVMLTLRKAANLKQHARAAKRDPEQECRPAFPTSDQEASLLFSELVAGREPDPQFAAEIAESCQLLLGQLDERQRVIAIQKMEGYTSLEIAQHLGCALTTIERETRLIRKKWQRWLTREEEQP